MRKINNSAIMNKSAVEPATTHTHNRYMTLLRTALIKKLKMNIFWVIIMDIKTLVKQISKFHKNYEKEFLGERIENKDTYLKNSEDAVYFIFSYSFYLGRRDEVSSKFEEKAKYTFESFLKNNDILSVSNSRITGKDKLKEDYSKLYDLLKKNGINKEGDRLMVVSLVNLIQSNHEKNILKLLIEKIKSKEIYKAYKILDSVWSIGPKISSLILRDIVYIYELEKYLKKPEDYYFLQPVDTWVHKLSKKIKLINRDKIYKDEARDITDKCFKFDVHPIHYNQGAWYIGANSLHVLLRNIEVIK